MTRLADEHRGTKNGFTLVELLVSMAIMITVLLLFARIITWVTDGWARGNQLADNLGKGRAAIDLITRDLQMGVFRPDLGAFTTQTGSASTTGSNYCFFVARNGGGDRPLTLVNYYVDGNATLERQVAPVSWANPAANPCITFGTNSIPQVAALASGSNTSELVTGVIAFQMYFVNSGSSGATSTYSTTFSNTAAQRTQGVGVAMILVDDKTQALLVALGKFQSLLQAGWGPPPDLNASHGLAQYWNQKVTGFFQNSGSGYPAMARSGIHVFESVVLLQTTGTSS